MTGTLLKMPTVGTLLNAFQLRTIGCYASALFVSHCMMRWLFMVFIPPHLHCDLMAKKKVTLTNEY